MPIPDKGPAPYAPGSGVMAFIQHVRERGIPDPVEQDYIGRIPAIGESYARRVLRALEQLDLVDPDTQRATPTLVKIKEERSDQLQATLAEWFQEAYKPVLNFISPTDDLDTIEDAFRTYTPEGQRQKMVRLFLHLARAAGFIDEIPNKPRGMSKTPIGSAPRPKAENPEKSKPKTTPQPQFAPAMSSAKERYLDLLMGLAEESNGKPDPELLDRIERVLGVPKQEVSS